MSRDPLMNLLATAAEIYDRSITATLAMAYRAALKGIPERDLVGAFQAHLADPQNGSFFPKPADLLRHIRSVVTAESGQHFDRLMQAACFGGVADVPPGARQMFGEITGGAGTFDMRHWGYERWDAMRTRFLKVAQANGSPADDTDLIEHDHHLLDAPE